MWAVAQDGAALGFGLVYGVVLACLSLASMGVLVRAVVSLVEVAQRRRRMAVIEARMRATRERGGV